MQDLGLSLSSEALAAAEARFREALRTGDLAGLDVLGYGEISTVVAIRGERGRVACKRLPPFDGRDRFEAYRELFEEYLERLGDAGLTVVPSELRALEDGDRLIAYCLQPVLEPASLGPRVLAAADPGEAREIFETLFEHVRRVVSPRLGFDGQISNWARRDGRWLYLDVSTPLLRDENGRDRLDSELFLAMLPAALRGLVRRFFLRTITDVYFDRRTVTLDLLGNLHKERLAHLVPVGVEAANRHLDRAATGRAATGRAATGRAATGPPFDAQEVRAYYRNDARLWELLLWLRRVDRFWQTRVRRRTYPFLLPGRIER